MRRQQYGRPVLGFYKGRNGETHPITKSAAELNRRKIITGSQTFKAISPFKSIKPQFKGISPEAQKRKMENAQRQLQHLDDDLRRTDSELGKLNESAGIYKTEAEKAHYEGNEGKLKSSQKSLRLTLFTLQSKMRHRKAVEQQIMSTKRLLR
jgi:hypothetical protein